MAITSGRVRLTGPVLHPPLCAASTAVSCAAHLWLAVSGNHGVWLGLLMIIMAAVCLPCTVHIWRHSRVGSLHQVTAAALVMVALHTVLLLGAGGAGHAHGSRPAPNATDTSGASQLLLVVGLELVIALTAATLVARLRSAGHLVQAEAVAGPHNLPPIDMESMISDHAPLFVSRPNKSDAAS
ncbi:hypothetical protein SAMN05660916_02384 [Arthrobacter sp. 31Cvi3.1E]|nr:hypothetical protein SAMN05660916_02384 [Arthrobacter sp. 31Cvi3.1E]